jgi:hypothetical protein
VWVLEFQTTPVQFVYSFKRRGLRITRSIKAMT